MIKSKNSNISISSCYLLSNQALGNDGGALYIRDTNKDITIFNTTISYNRAEDNGAGVYLWMFNSNISFICSMIRYEHFAKYYVDHVYHTTFIFFYLYFSMYEYTDICATCALLYICITSFNDAVDTGGGIFFFRENSFSVIRDSAFIGNTAYTSGAGLNFNNNNFHLLVERTSFVDNVIRLYGAGLAFGQSNYHMHFVECRFHNNSASFDGGAINFYEENNLMNFLKCNFTNNKGSEGAALNLYATNALMTVLYLITLLKPMVPEFILTMGTQISKFLTVTYPTTRH